ncbi:hypothetical protein GGI12_003651 [Dipsacomyces acuminosporus]|nr:hypothetical protein GGI12_003651 [Dipsacomyces acuminosporus]
MLISRLIIKTPAASTAGAGIKSMVHFARKYSTATTSSNSQAPRVSSAGDGVTSTHDHAADDGLESFAFGEGFVVDRHHEKAVAHDAVRAATFGEVRVLPAAAKYQNVHEMHTH